MENQRIRISKMCLKNALVDILQEKTIQKVTIRELCERAEINPTTFYKYYGNQYDLLEDIERGMLAELESRITVGHEEPFSNLAKIMTYLEENRTVWRLLLKSASDSNFAERLLSRPALAAIFSRIVPDDFTKKEMHYLQTFLYEGVFAIVREWINADERETPEEIAGIIVKMLMHAMPLRERLEG